MPEKYKKEVEEILEQAGVPPGRAVAPRRRPSFWQLILVYAGKAVGGRTWAITPGRVMIAAVVVLLLALVLRAGPAMGLVGLLLFIVAYAMFFMRPGNRAEKRWRGRAVEEEDDAGWWDRIRGR